MNHTSIDAALLAKMFLAGAANLDTKKEWINELNVFPVPDGDTGTNMSMTILSAAGAVQALDGPDMEELAHAISSGSLRGARGNSGVILSQLLRGFTRTIEEKKEIDIPLLAAASERAVETAYKAVMKPKEGTILTVAKGMADKARELSHKEKDLETFIAAVLEHGRAVLARTPEMLPVLKEAGVVDSGGQGLITVLEGAFDALQGKEIATDFIKPATQVKVTSSPEAEEEIRFGYCTEFIVNLNEELNQDQIDEFRSYLSALGDSLVLVADPEIVKIHVHTNDPGIAIQKGLSFGALTNLKIDNMRVEHHERVIRDAKKMAESQREATEKVAPKDIGFVAVAVGDGFTEAFTGLGVDCVIAGGQTMNPSTEDVLNAIDRVNAANVFLFPNNKNIILAANQAKELVQEKNVIVIPTTTVPQGISAMISYDPMASLEANQAAMNEAIRAVSTCEITYAVRDTTIDGTEIREGDIMAVGDKGILHVGSDIVEVAKKSIDAMMHDEACLVSIYYGEEFDEERSQEIAAYAEQNYPACDVAVAPGGQSVYYCVIAVE